MNIVVHFFSTKLYNYWINDIREYCDNGPIKWLGLEAMENQQGDK